MDSRHVTPHCSPLREPPEPTEFAARTDGRTVEAVVEIVVQAARGADQRVPRDPVVGRDVAVDLVEYLGGHLREGHRAGEHSCR